MTLKKLAALAGTSVATVSKAFSDSDEISDERKQEIYRLAKEHGCFDKYYKSTFGKKTIVIICPEVRSEIYASGVECLSRMIEKRNGNAIIALSFFSDKKTHELVDFYSTGKKADAIILLGLTTTFSKKPLIPIIDATVGKDHSKFVDTITMNPLFMTDSIVEYLIKMGHKKIAFISERLSSAKLESFCESAKQYGLDLPPEYIYTSNLRFEVAGYEGMKRIIAMKNRPTAVVTAYDYITIGALKAAHDFNISVPDDISLVGMDNISLCDYTDVRITSYEMAFESFYELVAGVTFQRIENKIYLSRQNVALKGNLILRDSVKNLLQGESL